MRACHRRVRCSGRSSRATRPDERACRARSLVTPSHVAVLARSEGDVALSLGRGDARFAKRHRLVIQDQVSLEPPPLEEFTTSSPSPSATRVRPPGSTQISSPSLMANGRRSMWRGLTRSSTNVGCVESMTGRWAIQLRGDSDTALAVLTSVFSSAWGPMTMPCRRSRRPVSRRRTPRT